MEHNQPSTHEWWRSNGEYNAADQNTHAYVGAGAGAGAADTSNAAYPGTYNVYDINNIAQGFHNQDMAELWNAQQQQQQQRLNQQHQAQGGWHSVPQYEDQAQTIPHANPYHLQQHYFERFQQELQQNQRLQREHQHPQQNDHHQQQLQQHNQGAAAWNHPGDEASPSLNWGQSWEDPRMAAEMDISDLQQHQPMVHDGQHQSMHMEHVPSRHFDGQPSSSSFPAWQEQEATSKLKVSNEEEEEGEEHIDHFIKVRKAGRPAIAKPYQEEVTWWREWKDKDEVDRVFAILKARVLGVSSDSMAMESGSSASKKDKKREAHLEKRIKELVSDTEAALMLWGSPKQQYDIVNRFQINERHVPTWYDELKKPQRKQLCDLYDHIFSDGSSSGGKMAKQRREYVSKCMSFDECMKLLIQDYTDMMNGLNVNSMGDN